MWISDKSAFRIPFTINIIKFNDHILLTPVSYTHLTLPTILRV
mgnify:CR=1 FL=1